MRKTAIAAVFLLAATYGARAQNSGFFSTGNNLSTSSRLATAPEATNFLQPVGEAAPALPTAATTFGMPASPEPKPKFYYGSNDDYRWQLGVGYEYVRFRSTPFNSNLNGLHTSLTYFASDWIGLEGNVVAAFGSKVFADETSKYLLYTGGPRIAWRQRRWEPWAHALFGGLHVVPQTAMGGKNGFAMQFGAGVDLRFNARLSFRMEGDYVRSMLYSETQNNFQGGAGIVMHF